MTNAVYPRRAARETYSRFNHFAQTTIQGRVLVMAMGTRRQRQWQEQLSYPRDLAEVQTSSLGSACRTFT